MPDMPEPTPVYRVTYYPNGGTGSTQYAAKMQDVPLTLSDGSGFSRSYYTIDGWATSASGAKAYNLGGTYTENKDIDFYAHWKTVTPNPVTNLTVTRNSDTKVTVKWTLGAGSSITYLQIYVERRTNGVGWSVIAMLQKTATSYIDTTTSANNRYEYRVIATGVDGGNSGYVTSGEIYMTPAAPPSVSGVQSGANVVLTVGNDITSVRNATGFDVQERPSGSSTWVSSTVISSSGTPVQRITVAGTGGGTYYRVRNTRGTLASAWSVSSLVSVIVPPNPPILVTPVSGGIVEYGTPTVVNFSWQHNSKDGTAQTAAQLRYSTNGGSTWTQTVTLTTQSTYSLSRSFSNNSTVTWQVRTKGSYTEYGDWSASSTFSIYKRPSVTVTAPSGTITNVPIAYAVQYSDDSGQFASGTVKVYELPNVDSPVYTANLPQPSNGTISGEIGAEDFIPANGVQHKFVFDVASNTNLTATADATVSVDMVLPKRGTLQIENDPDTGYVSLVFGWDAESTGQTVASVSLYRDTEYGRKLLATSEDNDSGCLDMYAPLNVEYEYTVMTVGTNNAVLPRTFSNTLRTGWWFAYHDGKIAKAKWNPNGTKSVSRPQQELVDYIGRKFPVSYDGTAVREEGSTEFRIIDRMYAKAFYELVADKGTGVYKSGDGEVFHANFKTISTASTHHMNQPYGSLTLPFTRIDGELL